jgi:hypothetical protein
VALVGDLPFVGLNQNGAGEPVQSGPVREHADDAGAALDLLVQPLERVGGPDLLAVPDMEGGEGGDVISGIPQDSLNLGELAAQDAGDGVELLGDMRRALARRGWCGSRRRPSPR